ncbi:MAG: xanthan lyase [Proteiniphilum sp.]|jgi:N-acetylmuramoyl-L-alanine amidase|nr:xanthan lyase [Proteiniphilum sp.]
MKKIILTTFILTLSGTLISRNPAADLLRRDLGSTLTGIYREVMQRPGEVTADSITVDERKKHLTLHASTSLSYLPMRENTVKMIRDSIRSHLPPEWQPYRLRILSDGEEIGDLIPNYFRSGRKDRNRLIAHSTGNPLVTNISSPAGNFGRGMKNNSIALWQSHGWYYEQKLSRWEWQRARLFQTVEDLYTQSYVLPFLVPMLENAGARVLMPRERDYAITELIIDNDDDAHPSLSPGRYGSSRYRETGGREAWRDTPRPGFANPQETYLDGENPFGMGTARQTETVTRGRESLAEWLPDIPETGEYGVYISYQTLRNSCDDALYSIYHAGGRTDFRVNQRMGGGTWIFLGHFRFRRGAGHRVTLSNRSRRAGKTVTADAVKIGGGMGNIARMPHPEGFEAENTKSSDRPAPAETRTTPSRHTPQTSGYPRYAEGARYWMQWAGVPDSIYSRTGGTNDYTDDYASRGAWVNWLAGGSPALPREQGLHIPVDLAFAFHTDAGTFWGDTIVGTLGIYMTQWNGGLFENGKSRRASRDLSELVMEEIIRDIRREFEPEWTRRHLWNRSYAEARMPGVPTMLLELLSHQNLADMRYGQDPTFRFTVSRAIYKGMLRFLATQYNRPYTVQPLPVKEFGIRFAGDTQAELTWQPAPDPAEPSAIPTRYIVHTRINDGGFDNGVAVSSNSYTASIQKDSMYSYRIVAVNDGGMSFPSETLSLCRTTGQRGEALIVNGFTRVSAPLAFSLSGDSIAGFAGCEDNGVPYIADHHFTGYMHEFRRMIPWMDDDASGFGDSGGNYETVAIAGNTFDYPYLHGEALARAGYSFVSASVAAVENGSIPLHAFCLTDWILGKQREWSVARGAMPARFKTFSAVAQQKITEYCRGGGNMIVSGAFTGSDLWDNPRATDSDRAWAQNTLRYKWRNSHGAVTGQIKAVTSPFPSVQGNYTCYRTPNSECYAVEYPDAIEPVGDSTFTVLRYTENNLSAGIIHRGSTYGTAVLGFPIEAVKNPADRATLLKGLLDALDGRLDEHN